MSTIFYNAYELAQHAHRGADPEDLAQISLFNARAYNDAYGKNAQPVTAAEIRAAMQERPLDPTYHAGGGLAYNLDDHYARVKKRVERVEYNMKRRGWSCTGEKLPVR